MLKPGINFYNEQRTFMQAKRLESILDSKFYGDQNKVDLIIDKIPETQPPISILSFTSTCPFAEKAS